MDTYVAKTGTGNLSYLNYHLHDLGGNKTTNYDKTSSGPLSSLALAPEGEQENTGVIPFTDYSERVCVSVIDIIGSTGIVSTIGTSKDIRTFYGIFLNKISNILKKYRAKIIKTVGDGIISYFPDTIDITNMQAFENVLECCFAQIENRFAINSMLTEQRLPTITYRVSVDFGKVEKTRFDGFDSEDLFGSTINMCSKMNLYAQPNGIVAGNDLYRIIRSFKQLDDAYTFHEMDSYYCGAGKYSYPLYSLSRMKQTNIAPVNPLNSTLHEIKKYVINGVRPLRNPKILLIDDELDDLFVLETFLLNAGFEVKSFSSPREALRHYANGDPLSYDLVISDIRMPEINGFQLYHKLKTINDNVKVIFASCLEIVEEISALLPDFKQEQLIQKPIERDKFIETVKKNMSK
jgi:two-component system, OmpR family, response regulator ChvI